MIRLKKVELTGFRGSPKSLPIEFGSPPRSMAIYGDNAAGKSSITDAIEWFYSNKVEHLSRENCRSDALRNVLLPAKETATVELRFNDIKLDCKKGINFELAISQSNKTAEFTEYLAKIDNEHERITLRTTDILYFTLQRKTERRKELERIIGYEALDKFSEIIGSTLYQLEQNPEYITAKSNFQSHQREILKIARTNISTDEELFRSGQRFVADLGISTSICDWKTYEAASAELRAKLHNKDQGLKKAALSDCRKKCDAFWLRAKGVEGEIEAFSKTYSELITSQEQVRQIRLQGFLAYGRKAIEDQLVAADTCPLCLQSIPWLDLIDQLNTRVAALADSKKKYETALARKNEALSMLSEASRAGTECRESARKLEQLNEFVEPIEAFSLTAQGIEAKIINEFEAMKPISIQIENESQAAVTSATKAAEFLRLQEEALELSAADQKLFDTVQRLENLKTEFQRFRKTSRTKGKFEQQIKTLSAIGDKFAAVHREALQNALDVMSEDISAYYLAMHPNEEIDKVRLSVIQDGVEFEYRFHGRIVYPPAKYLSESHLNSLAIAAFLASAKIFNKINNFLVLDDVITSFDSNHRVRLLRLLSSEFSGWQVIILTHERFWFEMIKKEMQPAGWVVAQIETVDGGAIQVKQSPMSVKEYVADKKQSGKLTANELRTLLERILKEVGFELEVKVAFRYNDENEHRMPGELLSELRAKLSKKSPGVLTSSAFSKMGVCSLVTTTGSHDSGPALSPGDLDAACEDVLSFEAEFCCEHCGGYVGVERFVSHEKKVYCKCGKKHLDWKE
jgi:recombinational DNA repair ATPase RecF